MGIIKILAVLLGLGIISPILIILIPCLTIYLMFDSLLSFIIEIKQLNRLRKRRKVDTNNNIISTSNVA